MGRDAVRAVMSWRTVLTCWFVILAVICGLVTLLKACLGAGTAKYLLTMYEQLVCFILLMILVLAPLLPATLSPRAAAGRFLGVGAIGLAFIVTALPFLIVLVLIGGATWEAFLGHLLVLVVTLGAVCGISAGLSAVTAPSRAAVPLTYLVVVALTIGTPLVKVTAEQVSVGVQRDTWEFAGDSGYCVPDPHHKRVPHAMQLWLVLVPNPFAALGDITAHHPVGDPDDWHIGWLYDIGTAVDSMRDADTREDCKRRAYTFFTPAVARHAPFWPASVVLLLALGCGGVVTASAAASRSRRGPPQPHDGK